MCCDSRAERSLWYASDQVPAQGPPLCPCPRSLAFPCFPGLPSCTPPLCLPRVLLLLPTVFLEDSSLLRPPAGVTQGAAPLPFPWSRSFSLLLTPCPLSIHSLCATLPFPSSVPPPPGVAQPSPSYFWNPGTDSSLPALKPAPVPAGAFKSPGPHISQDLVVVTES